VLKRKERQISEISKLEIQIWDIESSFPSPIIARGNSYYVRLDPHFIKFYELQPGDEILVTITKAKRENKRYERDGKESIER